MLDLRRLHEHGSNGHRRWSNSWPFASRQWFFFLQELRHRRGRKWCWSKQKVPFSGFFEWFFHHFEALIFIWGRRNLLWEEEIWGLGCSLWYSSLCFCVKLLTWLCQRLTCCLLAHPFGTICLKSWNICRYLMDVESKVRILDFWWQLSQLLDRKGPTRWVSVSKNCTLLK